MREKILPNFLFTYEPIQDVLGSNSTLKYNSVKKSLVIHQSLIQLKTLVFADTRKDISFMKKKKS